MSKGIPHSVYTTPRDFRVADGKLGVSAPDTLSRLADDLDVSDHGILLFLVGKKGRAIHPPKISIDPLNGKLDVLEIVTHARYIRRLHTGCASANTFARHFSGTAPGVSTSTSTPSNSLTSN